jgi:hypothetical protein
MRTTRLARNTSTAIGAWSYSGSRDNPVVRNTSNNNRIPELGQRDRQTGQRYLYLRPGSGAFAGKWISGQDGGPYSNLAMRPFDYLFGFQSDERVDRLINSSRGRWRTILPTNAIVGLQLMEISDGLNLARGDGSPINLASGQVLTLGTGADWALNPVFWVADGASEGVYSVGFRLLDLNTSQGYTPLRDSGVFYMDFYVVPEPASLLALGWSGWRACVVESKRFPARRQRRRCAHFPFPLDSPQHGGYNTYEYTLRR